MACRCKKSPIIVRPRCPPPGGTASGSFCTQFNTLAAWAPPLTTGTTIVAPDPPGAFQLAATTDGSDFGAVGLRSPANIVDLFCDKWCLCVTYRLGALPTGNGVLIAGSGDITTFTDIFGIAASAFAIPPCDPTCPNCAPPMPPEPNFVMVSLSGANFCTAVSTVPKDLNYHVFKACHAGLGADITWTIDGVPQTPIPSGPCIPSTRIPASVNVLAPKDCPGSADMRISSYCTEWLSCQP